jgi:hypothetical protein
MLKNSTVSLQVSPAPILTDVRKRVSDSLDQETESQTRPMNQTQMLSVLFLAFLNCGPLAGAQQFDVVVYGGTAAGVVAAVAAAREGLKVALLEPHTHLGGMVSGGLSQTDLGKEEVIGGYALEFYWRAGSYYDMQRHRHFTAWNPEPHVAEAIFKNMARNAGVTVFYNNRLREKTGIKKNGTSIAEISMEKGSSFDAKVFIDATYEGDLMAQADVSYTWGREGVNQWNEPLAGVRAKNPDHQFEVKLSPYDANGKLLPEIYPGPTGEPGTADKKVQAYTFRLCFSNDPANQVPFPRPKAYSADRYKLLALLLKTYTQQNRPLHLKDVFLIGLIPNNKADFNNMGAFSTDYIGGNWKYPEASYADRERIWQAHYDYVAGFLYFMAHDPQVPKQLQDEVNHWGLAKDEFMDTGNWPFQLYVREARRMMSDFVMTQKDIQTDVTKPDAIGMGSYTTDAHNFQRVVKDGYVMNEGDTEFPVKPYQIPYRILVPKRHESTNLIVPVCVSASHIAYGSLRMEPQYMIMGHAAGVAAKLAIVKNSPVQDIDTGELSRKLTEQGAVMEYVPSRHTAIYQRFKELFPR